MLHAQFSQPFLRKKSDGVYSSLYLVCDARHALDTNED